MAGDLLLGVNVLDGTPSDRPVQAATTAVAAFVGVTEKGPVNTPVRVTSLAEAMRIFGGYLNTSYLMYALRSFFNISGGGEAYIVRVVHYDDISDKTSKTSAPATLSLKDQGGADAISIEANSDGTWGNNIEVEVLVDGDTFTLNVYHKGSIVESFKNLKLDNCEAVVNEGNNASAYVKLTVLGDNIPVAVARTKLSGGADGLAGLTDNDYIGDPASKTGLYALDHVNVNLVAIPGITTKSVHDAMTMYCANRGDCFAVLDAPMGLGRDDVITYKQTLNAVDYGGIYYPWATISDPIGAGAKSTKLVPPCGRVMGVMARTDRNRGVWKAPAGEIDGLIYDAIEVETILDARDMTILNDAGVNCIASIPGVGIVVWGDRTLSNKYVNHIRLKLFIKRSFKDSFRWVVFEPIDDNPGNPNAILGPTGRVERAGNAFMRSLYDQGAFDGASPEEAYSVVCRRDNNPKEQTDQGRLNIDVAWRNKGVAEVVAITVTETR